MSDDPYRASALRADRAVCDGIGAAVARLRDTRVVIAQTIDIVQSAEKECRRIPVDAIIRLLLATEQEVTDAASDLDRLQHGTRHLPHPLSRAEVAE